MAQQQLNISANLKSGGEGQFHKVDQKLKTPSTRHRGDNSTKSEVFGEFRYPNLYYSTAYYPVNQYRVQRMKWF